MLCMRMDLDSTSTDDGFLFEELNSSLFKNKDEQGGRGFENESKELEERIQIGTNEELPRSANSPVGATYQELQSPASRSDVNGSLSPSKKADEREQHLPNVSDFDGNIEGLSLVHSTEAPTSIVEEYECHTRKRDPNDVGELIYNGFDDTLQVEMELGDSDPYLSHYNNHECKESTFLQTVDGNFDSISVDCSSEKETLGRNEIDCGNIVHETELKEDYHTFRIVPSDNGVVVRESSDVHSPHKETPLLPERDLSDLRGNETEPFSRQEQMPPKVNEANSSSPPKHIERSVLQSPERCLSRQPSLSPERQSSISFKRSPDTKSFARQDELPPEDSDRKPARFLKHTPSSEMQSSLTLKRSSGRALSRSASPGRQSSITLNKSTDTKSSARQDEMPPEKGERKPAHSPKHTPSPKRHTVGRKRASSRDRKSSPVRRKSPSGRSTHGNTHHRDYSPKKRLSSPRRRVSPGKRDKSVSRSPVRGKDSSIHRRDHKDRSRSRSPYARDHYGRSSRRGHSPRPRSPPLSYRSRRRSPRRPWSPPPNRNTGVGRPGRNLFIAGFSYATTERDLEKKFSRFGHVRGVRIVRDKRSGESRGFGFVSLERDEDADAAIRAVDRTEWNGRIVLVEKSKTPAC